MWEVYDVDGGRNNDEGKHSRVNAKVQLDGEPTSPKERQL